MIPSWLGRSAPGVGSDEVGSAVDGVAEVVAAVSADASGHRTSSRGPVAWLALLPLRIVRRLVVLSFRTGYHVGAVPLRVTRAASRRLGLVGTVCLVAGVVIGLLLAPVSGRQLRQRLRNLAGGTSPRPDLEVQAAVVAELASAPRTAALTRPQVVVTGGIVTLAGSAPTETARIELEAVAAGVPGVLGVVNELVVAGSSPDPDGPGRR